VDESNSTGAEILLRRMVPVEYFTWPFRRGIGADASGRRVRLVNALPIEADIVGVLPTSSLTYLTSRQGEQEYWGL
jgi:hypothetical protein